MLVLTRKSGEEIQIGDSITVKVIERCGNRMRLGIEAPEEIKISRSEIAACQPQWQEGLAKSEPTSR